MKRKKRRRMVVESIDVGFEAGKGRARSFFFLQHSWPPLCSPRFLHIRRPLAPPPLTIPASATEDSTVCGVVLHELLLPPSLPPWLIVDLHPFDPDTLALCCALWYRHGCIHRSNIFPERAKDEGGFKVGPKIQAALRTPLLFLPSSDLAPRVVLIAPRRPCCKTARKHQSSVMTSSYCKVAFASFCYSSSLTSRTATPSDELVHSP